MSIEADVVLEKLSYPSHITCPYCPAQSYPTMVFGSINGQSIRTYVCQSKHKFYAHPEEISALQKSS